MQPAHILPFCMLVFAPGCAALGFDSNPNSGEAGVCQIAVHVVGPGGEDGVVGRIHANLDGIRDADETLIIRGNRTWSLVSRWGIERGKGAIDEHGRLIGLPPDTFAGWRAVWKEGSIKALLERGSVVQDSPEVRTRQRKPKSVTKGVLGFGPIPGLEWWSSPRDERRLEFELCWLARQERDLGKGSIEVASQERVTGELLNELGRHEEALGYHRRAFATYKKRGLDGHLGGLLENIGYTLNALRRFDEALVEFRRAWALDRAAVGESGTSSTTPRILAGMGRAYCSLGRCEEAVALYWAEAERLEAIGRRYPGFGDSASYHLTRTGEFLLEVGRPHEAVRALNRALAGMSETPTDGAAPKDDRRRKRMRALRTRIETLLGQARGEQAP